MKLRGLLIGAAVLVLAGCGSTSTPPISSADMSSMESAYEATSSPTSEAVVTTSSASSVKTFPAKKFSGTGDDVVEVGDFTDLAVLLFRCDACTGNTVLKSDGGEGLLVNTIGAYSGTHYINLHDNSMTSRLTVNADAAWSIMISDTTRIPQFTAGHGDAAIFVAGPGDKARIMNRGEGNFVVQAYGAESGLLVNEIGSYSGTVPITPPAFVQVTSDGDWDISVG
jgi:hypothetical protein